MTPKLTESIKPWEAIKGYQKKVIWDILPENKRLNQKQPRQIRYPIVGEIVEVVTLLIPKKKK